MAEVQVTSIAGDKNDKPPLEGSNGNGNGNGFVMPKKVGLVHSEVKREYFPTESQYITEKDAIKDAKVVADYVEKMGIKALLYPGNDDLVESLKKDRPEMVFNLVGSVKGQEFLSATIPAVLELLDIPYTGAGILGESIVYNKFLSKKLLEQAGVPVPHYQLFNTPNDIMETNLRFPLISKLNEIHGAVELTRDSVSYNEKHLRDRLKFLMATYKQPILVEEFIVGREVTTFLLEGLNKKVYMAEKVFKDPQGGAAFAAFEDQWLDQSQDMDTWTFNYAKYEDPNLKEYVRKAFDVTKMTDYGKFDVRVDASGRYYFIDSNTNPAFGPKETLCAISLVLDIYGITFNEILRRLIINTIKGNNEDTS
jgi:D-alanine-D-alanine ligase